MTLFQRCNNFVEVQTTLLQRQNDVMCLLNKRSERTLVKIISRCLCCSDAYKVTRSPDKREVMSSIHRNGVII